MSYLDTIYSKDEYAEHLYPQKLCTHIYNRYFKAYAEQCTDRKPKLLDIGSGKGNHLVGFGRHGIEPYGLDKREECVAILDSFDIRECNIETEAFPFDDEFFDFAYSKSVLEHVRNVDNFLGQSLRILRPGGIAVFLTPDWKSQMKFFWDDYTHVSAFTRKSLQNAFKINGFANVDCDYFLQLPFVWQQPGFKVLTHLVALAPDSWKWKDKEESQHRTLIRFSKEKMLLVVGTKGHGNGNGRESG